MANPHPTKQGHGPAEARRPNHLYNAPTIGRIWTGVFLQLLTGETRTVEVVKYQGADCWKARIRETQSILCRLGYQVEYAGDQAACSELTEFFCHHGMRLVRQWEAVYPEWRAVAAIAPAARRGAQIPGGVQ